MKSCVFCRIIDGDLPAYKIYEDDFCVAFLDAANDCYGHTLVVPKNHNQTLLTLDNTNLKHLIEICKLIGTHYVKDCGFDGFNVICNSGEAAEQSINHVHFHIIPRKKNDGLEVFPKLNQKPPKLETAWKKLMIKQTKKQPSDEFGDECVILYTDGACSGNPGIGGWASILSYKGKEKILSGGEIETTNNRMELMAVIVGLESIKARQVVKVFSDSAYVVNAFNEGWIETWRKRKWRNSDGNDISNKELWFRLFSAMENKDVEFIKVKGHSDDQYNNRCDKVARSEISKLRDLVEQENQANLENQENQDNNDAE